MKYVVKHMLWQFVYNRVQFLVVNLRLGYPDSGVCYDTVITVTDFLFVRGRSGSFIWSAGLKYDINQQEEISAVCFNVSFLRRLCHCSAVGQLENHWCFKLLVHLAHRINTIDILVALYLWPLLQRGQRAVVALRKDMSLGLWGMLFFWNSQNEAPIGLFDEKAAAFCGDMFL